MKAVRYSTAASARTVEASLETARREAVDVGEKLGKAEIRAQRLETELTAARAAVATEQQRRAKIEHTVLGRLAVYLAH